MRRRRQFSPEFKEEAMVQIHTCCNAVGSEGMVILRVVGTARAGGRGHVGGRQLDRLQSGGQALTIARFQGGLAELVRQQLQMCGEAPSGVSGNVDRVAGGRSSHPERLVTLSHFAAGGTDPSGGPSTGDGGREIWTGIRR